MTCNPLHSRAKHPRAAARRGWAFTLIELVIVMAMIGIMAAIAVPRYSSSISRYRLEAATQRVIADLKAAQRQASTSSTSTVFTLNVATSTYTITGMSRLDRRSGVYTVNLSADPYFASVSSVSLGPGNTVTTDPYGTITGGGSLSISVGAFSHIITLDATNGGFTIQ